MYYLHTVASNLNNRDQNLFSVFYTILLFTCPFLCYVFFDNLQAFFHLKRDSTEFSLFTYYINMPIKGQFRVQNNTKILDFSYTKELVIVKLIASWNRSIIQCNL